MLKKDLQGLGKNNTRCVILKKKKDKLRSIRGKGELKGQKVMETGLTLLSRRFIMFKGYISIYIYNVRFRFIYISISFIRDRCIGIEKLFY